MSNPILDFKDAFEASEKNLKVFREIMLKKMVPKMNGLRRFVPFIEKRMPEPRLVHNADKNNYIYFLVDPITKLTSPRLVVKYKRSAKGEIQFECRLDSSPIVGPNTQPENQDADEFNEDN